MKKPPGNLEQFERELTERIIRVKENGSSVGEDDYLMTRLYGSYFYNSSTEAQIFLPGYFNDDNQFQFSYLAAVLFTFLKRKEFNDPRYNEDLAELRRIRREQHEDFSSDLYNDIFADMLEEINQTEGTDISLYDMFRQNFNKRYRKDTGTEPKEDNEPHSKLYISKKNNKDKRRDAYFQEYPATKKNEESLEIVKSYLGTDEPSPQKDNKKASRDKRKKQYLVDYLSSKKIID